MRKPTTTSLANAKQLLKQEQNSKELLKVDIKQMKANQNKKKSKIGRKVVWPPLTISKTTQFMSYLSSVNFIFL